MTGDSCDPGRISYTSLSFHVIFDELSQANWLIS